jgi:CubicO group peptidase (beta-lactamase class C family)
MSKSTFRHCFAHLLGFPGGHGSQWGLYNVYLDNALFVGESVFCMPGVRHRYNGDSYNLAGVALELTTGQSMFRLLHEHMQKPFGESATQFDLGFADQFTAMYLAKVGQMLLQDGAYGKHRFYSPGFVKTLVPRRVSEFAPELADKELEWGIGLTWMIDPEGPREKGILGPDVFGHGAASHSVWRVDPKHELVVVIGRNAGRDWGQSLAWAAKFMQILADGMQE